MPKKGKKGVDQRVKGNVKAASSGRMADLLGGESATGFIGFEAVSRGMGGEEGEGAGGVDEVSHGAGAEFQVVMKQLGKRDTTTKLKALQEFSVLCDKESLEAVVSVLNIWSLMYNKLSTDNDNRVREASHKALQSCVNKVKGSLGPHFRSLVGSWVSGMCDPHGSAASAAQAAFSAAFAPPKQTDALKFGFKAIVNFVEDITLKETQDTFSDPKVVPEDERLQRYERVVTMSLYGLSLTLQRLPVEHIRERQEDWESFLVDKRLWKLSRHRNPQIRASTFTVVATLCRQAPDFIRCRAKQFCSLVLSSLGEGEPVVVGPLWEATLLVIMGNEDWSEHVNVQKALLPGLWQLLGGGGHGSARVAYPCLLPLLRKLVEQVYQSDVHFATSFLERLKSGLQADSVRGSVSECESVLQTFNQAFLYLLLHVDTEGEGEEERKQFYRGAMNMVADLLEYSVGQCPRTQAAVVSGWVGRLLDDLLRTGTTHLWMEPYLQGWLQGKLTERMLALLEKSTDEAQFSRLGSLLSSLSTSHWKPASRRVMFAGGEEETTPTSGAIPGSGDQETPGEKEKTLELSLSARKLFLRPAVASLCAHCLASVCRQLSLEHGTLLCGVLRLYRDGETVLRIREEVRARFPSLLLDEAERGGGGGGGREGEGEQEEWGGERGGEEEISGVVVSLCGCLLKVVGAVSSGGGKRRLVEGVVSSILLLLQMQLVSGSAAKAFLERMVMENPSVLPLLLTKLGEAGRHPEWVGFLLQQRQPQLLGMVVGGGSKEGEEKVGEETFLWTFLDLSLATPGHFDSEEGSRMKTELFETICNILQSAYQEQRPSNSSRTQRLLHTLSRATPEVVGEYFTQRPSGGHEVLHCLLNWCLKNCRSEASLLTEVSCCYSHLTALLPDPAGYLQSTANRLTSLVDSEHGGLERVFDMAVAVHVLHSPALTSYGRFWSLYQPLQAHTATDNERFIPLAALESFCSSQPYSPFFKELSSDRVISSLSGPRLSILFLASALCDSTHMSEVLSSLSFTALLAALDSQKSATSTAVAFPLQEDVEGERRCYQRWKVVVCEVMLALCALQPSVYKQHSPVEAVVVTVLHSALESCLGVGFGGQEWCRRLLKELVSRASAEGPLWCLVLQIFFASVEKTLGDDRRDILSDFMSLVFEEPEAPLALAALGGLSRRGRAECKGHLTGSVRGRESDVCLLAVCLHLFSANDDIVFLARKALSEVASKHANSEITLFDSLEECVQDPISFSLLELISHLTTADMVPSSAWELILCSLVTIVQLLSDSSDQHRSSVNLTVFYCKAMRACSQTARFLCSPLAPSDQASEWSEFFCPDIEHRLLPVYLVCATESGTESPSYCHIHQYLYLSRAVAEVCTNLNTVPLEVLIDILMSSLYPFKVAAFILAKRLVATVEFCVEVSTAPPPGRLSAVSVTTLKEILGKAVEHVNLDLTFLEEAQDGSGCYDNTSSYLLLWLLIIEIMSHCGPEARASLGEWLKELSLFNHLLHGLFKYLSDADSSLKSQLEVTLLPDPGTLSTVLYSTVARHLPSMLRQWYLSLDRATSTIVTQFTTKHVSPALQQTELQSVGKSSTTHGNMEVRAYAGASEVSVIYRIHEFSIELFVYLPDNYPLQPPSIREGRRVRVEASQWRKWMLQLNVFVTNQNGTLMDGLLLWKSNLDKHFSGVEDCMICFSVIHSSLYSLPKMTCRTCKKKFHSACLYKWFSTSNKSSCPLCRNIF